MLNVLGIGLVRIDKLRRHIPKRCDVDRSRNDGGS